MYREEEHRFPFKWTLKDANFTKDKGKVFSLFSCGGGSTMGYKLAGYDVIGNCEIDPKVNKVYIANHHPLYSYCEDIREFKNRKDLPEELYNLDILDSSPPCTTFSMSGQREKTWGVEKVFHEGQAKQVLDTLFFDTIEVAKKLQPKVFVAENVKGLILGNAIKYMRKIYEELDDAGYYVQHFLLDASKMGVPQKRERVFVICLRKDLASKFLVKANLFEDVPYIDMNFYEKEIPVKEIGFVDGKPMAKWALNDKKMIRCEMNNHFSATLVKWNEVFPTLQSRYGEVHCPMPDWTDYWPSKETLFSISTFPQDYDLSGMQPQYVCGMSVPPVMIANIATNIYEQWLSKIE